MRPRVDRDLVARVEVDELVAAEREHVERRKRARPAEVRPPLARRRRRRSWRRRVPSNVQRLRAEGREVDVAVERELPEVTDRRRGIPTAVEDWCATSITDVGAASSIAALVPIETAASQRRSDAAAARSPGLARSTSSRSCRSRKVHGPPVATGSARTLSRTLAARADVRLRRATPGRSIRRLKRNSPRVAASSSCACRRRQQNVELLIRSTGSSVVRDGRGRRPTAGRSGRATRRDRDRSPELRPVGELGLDADAGTALPAQWQRQPFIDRRSDRTPMRQADSGAVGVDRRSIVSANRRHGACRT